MKFINKVLCLIIGIFLLNIGYIYSQTPVKWDNVKHMKLTGEQVIKSSTGSYDNSMVSCQVSKGSQSITHYVEHTITASNAMYGFGLYSGDVPQSVERAEYFFLVKKNGGLNAYAFAPNNTYPRYLSYSVGNTIRIERQGTTIRFKRDNYTMLVMNNVPLTKKFKVMFNLITPDVSVDANMRVNFSCDYIANATDITKNHTTTTIYDGLGEDNCNILSENRTYFDELGRKIQSQSRLKTDDQVWASEVKYDGWGRQVISTLSAPTKDHNIAYQPDFFNNEDATSTTSSPYNWEDDFDKGFDQYINNPNSTNALGGVNNPRVLEQGRVGSLGWYYSSNNTYEVKQATTNYPYSRTEYSLLTGKPRKSAGPGDAHRMGSNHEISAYKMRLSQFHELYSMFGLGAHPYNIALQYNSDDDGNLGLYDYTGTSTPSSYTNALMENKIVKNITIDADGKEAISFIDLDGNILASCLSGQLDGVNVHIQKVSAIIPIKEYRDIHIPEGCSINNATAYFSSGTIAYQVYDLKTDKDLGTTTSLTALAPGFYRIVNTSTSVDIRLDYTLNYHNFTINIYNSNKQSIAIVPPNGIDYNYCDDGGPKALNLWAKSSNVTLSDINVNDLPDHKELTLTKYNKIGKAEWLQTPDAGRTYFAYNRSGKLRFSQNKKQQNSNRFSYTNYDKTGRLIETGIYVRKGNGGYFFSHEVGPFLQVGTSLVTDPVVAENAFNPSCSNCLKERSYITYDTPALVGNRTQKFVRMRVAKTWDDNGNATWYSYNTQGRNEWIAKQIAGISGIKYTDMTYDVSGNLTHVEYQKDEIDQFIHHYSYNEIGDVISSATEDAWGAIQVQTEYDFYQNGSLKSVDLGDGLQEMEYTYTIHGSLKGVNLDQMNLGSSATNKVFSMALDYYQGDYTPAGGSSVYTRLRENTINNPSYRGNIAMARWKTNTNNSSIGNMLGYFAYQYEYNHRNELKSATFGGIAGLMSPKEGLLLDFIGNNNYKVDNIKYDLNGNIEDLRRKGASSLSIDNLKYHYKHPTSNQLDYIQDFNNTSSLALGDIQNGQSAGTYLYSEIGELIEDKADGLLIEYNNSGKVTAVKDNTTNKLKVRYYYDESGTRVKKATYDNGNLMKTTFYVYGAQGLQSMYEQVGSGSVNQTELPIYGGGRIGVAYAGIISNALDYKYELTDHLGNVRAVIRNATPNTSSTTLEVTYYADYYPFGWVMPGRNGGSAYRYAYQGQEKDEETGWEAFELRMYDGRVGRWMTTDPYSEFHSPYLAMANNPISKIDPTGGCTDCPTMLATIPIQPLQVTPVSALPAGSIQSVSLDAWKILNAIEHVDRTDINNDGYGHQINKNAPDIVGDIETMAANGHNWINTNIWTSEGATGGKYNHYTDRWNTDASVNLLLLGDHGSEVVVSGTPEVITTTDRVLLNTETGQVFDLGGTAGVTIDAVKLELSAQHSSTGKTD